MGGRRRTQRSVRVTVAATLVAFAASGVGIALALSTAVGAAAVLAVAAGAVAVRMLYAEVLQTRRDTSRSRADQALAFATALTGLHADYSDRVASLSAGILERDRSIRALSLGVRLAEERTETQRARAEAQTRRADDTQARLSTVLDAVLVGPAVEPLSDQGVDDTASQSRELPTVVDLLAWEERTAGARADRGRRRA